ncbi:WD40 repeat domain-containing protein [Laspinema olomoucense]|uniref:WD40 repeat domain-containing protein n=1 Tax=Laspinema olomoucense TaxID=3231600 RepID=UPI0021BB2CA0|nr:WD40 repeat domain-containing protein [Laspinema sp. D3d]MCT7975118.1 WD40 repeat domain-containing protein [Laspinema sp. D3d]
MTQPSNQPPDSDKTGFRQNPTPAELDRGKYLENIKKSWESAQVEERVAGLIQSLQFGTEGLDLFIQQALQDDSEQVKQAAYWVLHGHHPYLAYPDERHPTEFAFPTDTISSLASGSVSLNRKILAGGSWKIIRIWDLKTGHKLRTLEGHSDWVLSVAFSPNGKIIASSSADRTINLWQAETDELLHTLQGHSSWVNAVAITPDGKTLVSASADRTLKLWNVTTGELIRTLEGHSGSVMSLAISPDGKIIASGSADKTIKLWYVNGSEAIASWEGHSDWVQAVAIAPNGKTFVSGSRDGEIRIWNADETPQTVNSGSEEIISSMNLSESGIHPILWGLVIKFLSVFGLSPVVALLVKGINSEKNLKSKFAKFKCSEVIQGQTLNIHGLVVLGNQPEVIWSGEGDFIQGWNFDLQKLTTDSDAFVGTMGIVPNPKRLITGGNDWVKLWDLTTGQQLHQFEGRSRPQLKKWEIFGLSQRVIYCGTQYHFKAKGIDQYGQDFPLNQVTWTATGGTIEDNGNFNAGQESGEFNVKATIGNKSKEVSVILRKLATIKISPNFLEITPDQHPEFTIEGFDQDNNKIPTGPINWSVSSGRMDENRFIPDPNAKGKITVTATATQTNIERSVDVIVRSVLRGIEIHPQQCTLEPNQPQEFEIKGFDQANEEIEINLNQIIWQNNGGRIEGQKTFIAGHNEKGSFQVTAHIEQYRATADVTIIPVLRTLTICPKEVRLEPYQPYTFKVTGLDQHQQEIIDLPEVQWKATDGSIEKQGPNECKFTAGENGGNMKITATARDCSDNALISVCKLERLRLEASPTTVEFGKPVNLTLQGFDNFGHPIELKQIDWDSEGRGRIDEHNQIFYADHVETQVTITARVKGVPAFTTINVIEPPRLTNLVISPSSGYQITPDDQPCFTVEGLDQRENPIATGPINWSVSSGRMDENRFIPDPNAKGKITVTATATQTNIERSVDVIVRSALRRIEIHPQQCTLAPNQSQDFEIKGFDQANEEIEIDRNQIIWQTNGGRIEGQKTFIAGHDEKGYFQVTATVEQYTDKADVTIIGVLRTLTISPQQVRLEPYEFCTFQVRGLDQHQQEIIPLPEVQWDATDGIIKKQSHNECKFTAGENGGEIRVTARGEDCQDEAFAFVEKLNQLILTASQTTVEFGNSVKLTVRGLDNFNNPRELRQIYWQIQGQGAIDELNRIFYAGHVEEAVTITAREKGVSDSITINVIEPPRLTNLVISPSSGYQITPDDRPCFTVEGLDQRGEEIEIGPVEWSCTGCSMQGNMFIPDSKAKGTYTVTVTETQAKRTESVEVTVVSVLKRLEIHPHHSISVEPQEEKAFTVKGFDQTGAPIELQSIKWECSQGGKIDRNGVFIGNYKKREVEIKATGTCGRRTLTESVQVTLLPVLKTLEIQPQSPIQLKPEEIYLFTVKGFDQYGDEIETGKIDWDSTGGEIDEHGKFTADHDAKGKFLVTATVTRETKSQQRLKIARLGLYLIVISWLLSLDWVQDLVGEEFITQENDPNPDPELLIATDLNLWVQQWFVKQIARLLSWILRGVAQICLNQGIEIITDSVEVTVIPVLREFKLNPESVILQPGQKQIFTVIGLDQQINEIEIEIETNVKWKSSSGGSIENGSFTAGDTPCEVEVTALLNEEICLSSKVTIEAKNYQGKLGFRPVIPCLTPAGGLLLRTPTGHSNSVNAVAITPDGKRAVSASLDKTLKLWDLATGEELATFSGHSNWVEAVTITPDGKQAVSASRDNTLKLWNLPRGEEVATLTGHGNSVNAVAITPDGKQAVSASGDNTLKLWDLTTGEKVATLTGHSNWVNAVAITPDGKQAVSASRDNTLKLWDLVTGEEVATLTGHSNWVTAVVITPEGKQVVSASKDGTVKLWDLDTGSSVVTLTGHGSGVTAVAITPDGQQVVSASWDRTLKLWDLATGEVVASFSGVSKFRSCAVAPDGVTVVAGEESGQVLFLRLEGV